MTVMIAEFFGLPHFVVRGGKLKKLNGTSVSILTFLWHASERFRYPHVEPLASVAGDNMLHIPIAETVERLNLSSYRH